MEYAYRYPGVKPFTLEDANLFFGRAKEIEQMVRYLRTENLVVLHGKSGLGKSSLINAGVLPLLKKRAKKSYTPRQIRLSSFNPRAPRNLHTSINQQIQHPRTLLDDIPVKYVSLWHALKSLELAEGWDKKHQHLLIFDQFEELFTYPKEEVEQLAHDLADLYNHRVPSEIRKLLRREKVVNKVLQNALEESGLADWLDSPLDVKILVAIRSDKFNELDRLTPYLPEIMLNSRILNPLSRDQAADAIRMPAEMEGDFPTPAFRYAPEAEQKLLEYLTDNQSKAVEGFQLQIICRNIEDKVASFADDPTKLEEDDRLEIKKLSGEGPQFEVADLDADFGDILRRYYNQQIRSLGDREKQLVARTLIEEELIADDRRVSLDHAILTQKVDEDLLKKLVDSRLIRREANTLGGFSYEISHDTLLDPILEARAERRMIEEANREREEARQAAADRQQEYERLKEKQAKDLAQARAETAELAKQRALQAQKTERRNKYFVLTLLIMVLIISGIGFSWWLTASWSYREIQETNSLLAKTNEKLIDAQKELEVQNEYLVDSLGFSSQRLEALRNELKISPSSEQRIYRRNAAFQDLISHLADTLLDYPGMREGRVPSGEYILERGVPIIRLHVFRPNEFAMQEDAQEMVEKVAAVLQKTPTFEIEVQSHTDQIGPAYNNIQNSVTRGMAVMEIFRAYFEEGEQGLRLNLAAKGESMPLRGGTRAQNRRIDLVLKQN